MNLLVYITYFNLNFIVLLKYGYVYTHRMSLNSSLILKNLECYIYFSSVATDTKKSLKASKRILKNVYKLTNFRYKRRIPYLSLLGQFFEEDFSKTIHCTK